MNDINSVEMLDEFEWFDKLRNMGRKFIDRRSHSRAINQHIDKEVRPLYRDWLQHKGDIGITSNNKLEVLRFLRRRGFSMNEIAIAVENLGIEMPQGADELKPKKGFDSVKYQGKSIKVGDILMARSVKGIEVEYQISLIERNEDGYYFTLQTPSGKFLRPMHQDVFLKLWKKNQNET